MDPVAKKTLLRRFHYGLFVLTARHGERPGMMTVNFVTQSAFEPPCVAVAMELASETRTLVEASGAFALNLLGEDQRDLAGKLGKHSARDPRKLEGIDWRPGPVTGSPVLAETLGWLECRVTGRIPSGDHWLYVAEVVDAVVQREGGLLTMAAAGYRHFG